MADDGNWLREGDPVGSTPLTRGEVILLAALRSWAHCRLAGQAPQAEVRALVAAQISDRAAALFVALMESLERQTARPLEVRCGDCLSLAVDEQRLLVACGIARVDMGLTRAILQPLVLQPEPVAIFARALSMVMGHEGLPLPARLGGADDGSAGLNAGRPTLH